MAFKNTNLSLLAYNTGYILRRNALISRILSQSSGMRFTPGNGYTYEIFTQPGQFTVSTPGYMDIMLVGGGAGGGVGAPGYAGGGGGAGAMRQEYNYLFPQGIYSVTIGPEGGGGSWNPLLTSNNPTFRGVNGSASSVERLNQSPQIIITAPGGGGGGAGNVSSPPGNPGNPGGSGGGASSGGGSGLIGSASIIAYGSPGGPGDSGPTGGGGGGAGGAGFGPPSGAGGDGRAAFSGDTGIPVNYGTPGPTPGRFFAGGGAGGSSSPVDPIPRSIGGGGGRGANGVSQEGLPNTGGGGSGGHSGITVSGNKGGSGIIILRYITSL